MIFSHLTFPTTNNKSRSAAGIAKFSNDTLQTCYYLLFVLGISSIYSVAECQKNKKSTPGPDNQTLKRSFYDFEVHNFSIPRNDPIYSCLKMEASLYFETNYKTKLKNGTFDKKVNFTLNDLNNFKYFGICSPKRNLIEFQFLNNWNLKFYFYKNNNSYLFNHVILYYKFEEPLYSSANHNGAMAEIYDKTFINTSLSNSFTCMNGIKLDLGNVVLYIQNLRVQPFFTKQDNYEFGPEIICSQDLPPNEEASTFSIWVIILIVIVILICFVLFVVFRISSDDTRNKNRYRNEDTRDKKEYNSLR